MKVAKLAGSGLLLVGSALLLGAAAPSPKPGSGNAEKCAAMTGITFGGDVEITSAAHVEASPAKDFTGPGGWPVSAAIPAHCRIEGIVDRRVGAGGKTYGIRFAIALPDQWSGRFLLQGGGGLNGSVGEPLGPVASDGTPALARGFAVISDDSGHEGAVFDPSFMADQRAALDFAETSVLTTTKLGKAITTAYYGEPIAHSYMTGCSTGGREGMLASQRYPELFDGIIVGAPAMRAGDSNLAIEYAQVLFNQAAPKDAAGKPIMSEVLTDADRKTILDGLLGQCDSLDGLKDGMIENVFACHFKPQALMCRGAKQDGCLSAGQVRALTLGLAGPFDKAGYPIYAPMAADTGMAAKPMGWLPTGGPGPFGPPSTATSIDLDARAHDLRWDAVGRLTDTPYWTNLNTYLGHGGKMIFFHGMSDFWFSPWATWDWYQRAAKTNGSAFADASRFYMVPGMSHCQGGNSFDQFDMLGKLVDWVEKGEAPEAVVAHRRSPASNTRLLCPAPSYAAYSGGDPTKATSFACKLPG